MHTKKKIAIFVTMLFLAIFELTAEEPDLPPDIDWSSLHLDFAPMYYWEYQNPVTLNGKTFQGSDANGAESSFADSYCEQEGYALVTGRKLHYWLYDTYTYHNGDGRKIYKEIVPRWVEDMGYVIDYDNVYTNNNNTALAKSVKILMSQRKCDVSIALITKANDGADTDYVVINNYDRDTGIYSIIIYYLYK